MKKVYVYTNTNCRRRLIDSKKVQLYFFKNNFKIVNHPKEADFVIYITCAYRDEITNSTLEKIKELQKYNGELIVAGCLPLIEEQKLFKIFKGKTISTKDIEKIVATIDDPAGTFYRFSLPGSIIRRKML